MKGVYAVGLLWVAALATDVIGFNFHSQGKKPIRYYDWQQWLSKNKDGKSSSAVGSDGKTSKGGDGYDWKQWLSNSYGQIPSGLEEKYSFSPYDWEQYLSTQQLGGIRKYDWKQWLSKNKDGKSSSAVGSDDKTSKGGDGYDWKQWLSNSYGQIPSGLEEKYSFSPYDWQQYLSTQQLGGIRKYDWKQWLSKNKDGKSSSAVGSDGKTSKGGDGYDWKQWLSNSYGQIPSGLEEKYSFSPYDWEQYLSTQQLGGIRKYDWKQWLSKNKDGKSSSAVGSDGKTSKGGDGYDWKQWLSNSYGQIPSGLEEKYSFSPYDWEQYLSTQQLGGIRKYDWKQWLSKNKDGKSSSAVGSDGKTSKGGDGYDWKQWLSNSYGQIPSGLEEKYSFSPYDWEQYLSTQQLGGIRKYDWKQWLSNSYGQIPSGLEEKYSFSPYDWEQYLSTQQLGGIRKYDWKQWLSNSYGQIPSGLEEKYSFSPYDWEQWLSNSYIPDGVMFYDWKQKFSKKSSTKNGGKTRKPKFSKSGTKVSKSNNGGKYDWKQWLSKSVEPSVKPEEVEKIILSKSSEQGKGGYDWKQWLSQSGGSDGGYDWKQWLSKSKD